MSLLKENRERIQFSRELRKPAPLRQPDDMACVSAVTTQILYMTRKIATPDVTLVDSALERKPDQPADSNEAYLLLLESGLKIHSICNFDEKRYIGEGLPYLKEYYKHQWTDAHESYYSPLVVDNEQRKRETHLVKFGQHPHTYITDTKTPTITDVTAFIKKGHIVDVTIQGDTGIVAHAALVYGVTNDAQYKIYDPDTKSGGLRIVLPQELAYRLLPEEGIVGIKP